MNGREDPPPSGRANPYVGPKSFRRDDRMFGRDAEAEDLLDLLLAERIVLLHSPSGAGKSSLIHAKLIGMLEHEGLWVFPVVRFIGLLDEGDHGGINPYTRSVARILAPELLDHTGDDDDGPSEVTLTTVVEAAAKARPKPNDTDTNTDAAPLPCNCVLVFDQFEEVLTLDPIDAEGSRAELFRQLGLLLRERWLWVLFAIREEYVAALDPHINAIPTRLQNRFRLEYLRPAQARDAIIGPAKHVGVSFEDQAASEIVEDLRKVRVHRPGREPEEKPGPYVEPVHLQVVCHELWNEPRKDPRVIAWNDIRGGRHGVDAALESYYRSQLRDVAGRNGISMVTLCKWIDEKLITNEGIRIQVLEQPSYDRGLTHAILEDMVAAYLLRKEDRNRATWYELAHDRLVEPARKVNDAVGQARRGRIIRALVGGAAFVFVAVLVIAGVLVRKAERRATTAEQREGNAEKRAEEKAKELEGKAKGFEEEAKAAEAKVKTTASTYFEQTLARIDCNSASSCAASASDIVALRELLCTAVHPESWLCEQPGPGPCDESCTTHSDRVRAILERAIRLAPGQPLTRADETSVVAGHVRTFFTRDAVVVHDCAPIDGEDWRATAVGGRGYGDVSHLSLSPSASYLAYVRSKGKNSHEFCTHPLSRAPNQRYDLPVSKLGRARPGVCHDLPPEFARDVRHVGFSLDGSRVIIVTGTGARWRDVTSTADQPLVTASIVVFDTTEAEPFAHLRGDGTVGVGSLKAPTQFAAQVFDAIHDGDAQPDLSAVFALTDTRRALEPGAPGRGVAARGELYVLFGRLKGASLAPRVDSYPNPDFFGPNDIFIGLPRMRPKAYPSQRDAEQGTNEQRLSRDTWFKVSKKFEASVGSYINIVPLVDVWEITDDVPKICDPPPQ